MRNINPFLCLLAAFTLVSCTDEGDGPSHEKPRVQLSTFDFTLESFASGAIYYHPWEDRTGMRAVASTSSDTCGMLEGRPEAGTSILFVHVFGDPGTDCPISDGDYLEGCTAEVTLARFTDKKRDYRIGSRSGTVRYAQAPDGRSTWQVQAEFIKNARSTLECEGGTSEDGTSESQCTCMDADGSTTECSNDRPDSCCNDDRSETETLTLSFESAPCDAACACVAGITCGCSWKRGD